MKRVMKTLALAAASLAILVPALACAQPGVEYFSSDAILTTVLSDSMFVAGGRIGDRGGAAEFELSLGPNMATPFTTAGLDWISDTAYPFSLAFEPVTRVSTFTLGGQVLHFTSPFTAFDSIFIRTFAQPSGDFVGVYNLVLNGSPVPGESVELGPDGLKIMQIYGMSFGTGFTLDGTVKMKWGTTAPTGDGLSFQIFTANMLVVGTEDHSWGQVKNLFR